MNVLNKTLLPQLLKIYPDNPAMGSPYAPSTVSPTDRFYQPLDTNQYKRLSAILGDLIFQAGRRILLDAYIARDKYYPVYNYLFTAPTPSAPAAIGVFHGSEIPYGQLSRSGLEAGGMYVLIFLSDLVEQYMGVTRI